MAGLLAAEFRGAALNRVDEESSACQETIVVGGRGS
jgi:hypothetical protein